MTLSYQTRDVPWEVTGGRDCFKENLPRTWYTNTD